MQSVAGTTERAPADLAFTSYLRVLLLYVTVLVGSFAVCAVIARLPILRRGIGL